MPSTKNQHSLRYNYGLLRETQQRLRELSKKKDQSKSGTTVKVDVYIHFVQWVADILIAVR